mmetsp:Transcript_55279/g.91541  ORF Transcript_55279/g.91541 Transcript_55279/m.91541 type:complete len:407 (+) Transcript_55279:95-1315(+)
MQALNQEDHDEGTQEYAWEGLFNRSWETVEESADGSLRSSVNQRWKRRSQSIHVGVKRGVMRSVILVLDCSRHAADLDAEMKPTRLAVMTEAAIDFVKRFFEQNPVSKLALLVTRHSKADVLTPLSCNARLHVQALKGLANCGGEASLQNALELARELLSSSPSFIAREVVLFSASLTTCDPGDLHATIAQLVPSRVRCSVFSLLAEVFICRKLARETGGEFGVALGPDHLRDLLSQLVSPRPIEVSGGNAPSSAPSNSLMRIGFPVKRKAGSKPGLCFSSGSSGPIGLSDASYECPQCCTLQQDIPTECAVCALRLLASTDLTKTYHHLFPLPPFVESTGPPDMRCDACGDLLPGTARTLTPGSIRFECKECNSSFCAHCDELLHSSLHACPSCRLRAVAQTTRT